MKYLLLILFSCNLLAEKVEFNQHIRPILSDKCFHCHGPDEKHIKGKLQLHKFDKATKKLGKKKDRAAIVPGDVKASTLWGRINTSDEDDVMPPLESHKELNSSEKELIKKWIEQGANYEDHWSFIPIANPQKELTKSTWGRSSMDSFVLSVLEKNNLQPMPEANKATLLRRVSFDLTGLPPTEKELDDFLADKSSDAYEKVVDRLLKSTHYGEHMGRFWLDAARYGDTHGLHLDNYRSMWPYRDWVINAFNNNMPFSQFTIEQLAGDLLPGSTLNNKVASGFNRCNVTTSEGGSIAEEYIVRYAVDRTSTTSTVWLGLTAGCAVCHDHKFDPISTKEFYSLSAFFNNITEKAMDGNKESVPPVVRVLSDEEKSKMLALDKRISDLSKELATYNQNSEDYKAWLTSAEKGSFKLEKPKDEYLKVDFENLNSLEVATSGKSKKKGKLVSKKLDKKKHFTRRNDSKALKLDGKDFVDLGQAGDFERDQPFSYGSWVKLNKLANSTLVSKLDNNSSHRGWDLYFAKDLVAVHLIHSWPGNAIKITTTSKIAKNKWTHVFVTYDGSSSAKGVKVYFNGKAQKVKVDKNNLKGSIKSKATLNIGRRYTDSPLIGEVDDLLLFNRALSASDVASIYGHSPIELILKEKAAKRNKKQKAILHRHFLDNHSKAYLKTVKESNSLKTQKKKIESSAPTTLVMQERAKPRGAFILKRGQYDQRGEKVEPDVPAFLPAFPKGAPKNRLGFAKWLLLPEHPLTSRVTVNRFWLQLFGTGIVETAEDFGSQGSWPSHPKLLDHLAHKFISEGWNVKEFMKYLVLSATYRQSSKSTDSALKKDPYNRLLSRGPRFRLDAEMLRDNALAVSGLLSNKVGGKPVKPYQPKGIWKSVGYTKSNTSKFVQGKGEALYRRTLYTFFKRTAPAPIMAAFDAPNRESCSVRRERTNTPLQALQLMNDVQFIEAARHLASNILKAESKDEVRLSKMFRKLTSRLPNKREMSIMHQTLEGHRQEFKKNPKDASAIIAHGESATDKSLNVNELAAWTILANQLLNLDEVLNKE
jgi:hypothetical protein